MGVLIEPGHLPRSEPGAKMEHGQAPGDGMGGANTRTGKPWMAATCCGLVGAAMGTGLSVAGVLSPWIFLGQSPVAWATAWGVAGAVLVGGAGVCSSLWTHAELARRWNPVVQAARGMAMRLDKPEATLAETEQQNVPEAEQAARAFDWAVAECARRGHELHRAEAMFESLSSASGHGMFLCRADGSMAKSNAKFNQMAEGASHIEDMAEPESRQGLRSVFELASADMARCRWEGWAGARSGERWISLVLVPMESPSPEEGPGMYVGYVNDMSEMRRVEDRLAFERDKARRVMEAVNDAVMFLDAYGHVERASAGMLAMLGKTGHEVGGLWVGRVVKLTRRADGEPATIEEMLTEEGVDFDGWNMEVKGGGAVPVEVRWRRLRGDSFEGVLSARDISKRIEEIDGIKWEAEHDELTGLMNRRSFALAMRDAQRSGGGACLMIDLDGFKGVNDTHGHDAGDSVLKMASKALMGLSEPGDCVARLGGDEFAILMPKANGEVALRRAQSVGVAIYGLALEVGGVVVSVGASVGVSEIQGGDGEPTDALKRADEEMYKQKQSRKANRSPNLLKLRVGAEGAGA